MLQTMRVVANRTEVTTAGLVCPDAQTGLLLMDFSILPTGEKKNVTESYT